MINNKLGIYNNNNLLKYIFILSAYYYCNLTDISIKCSVYIKDKFKIQV